MGIVPNTHGNVGYQPVTLWDRLTSSPSILTPSFGKNLESGVIRVVNEQISLHTRANGPTVVCRGLGEL